MRYHIEKHTPFDGDYYLVVHDKTPRQFFAKTWTLEDATKIAAIPQMLEALEKTESWVAQYATLKGHEAAAEIMLAFIRAAIREAKGPTP